MGFSDFMGWWNTKKSSAPENDRISTPVQTITRICKNMYLHISYVYLYMCIYIGGVHAGILLYACGHVNSE